MRLVFLLHLRLHQCRTFPNSLGARRSSDCLCIRAVHCRFSRPTNKYRLVSTLIRLLILFRCSSAQSDSHWRSGHPIPCPNEFPKKHLFTSKNQFKGCLAPSYVGQCGFVHARHCHFRPSGDRGPAQRTTNLSSVLQEIIDNVWIIIGLPTELCRPTGYPAMLSRSSSSAPYSTPQTPLLADT